MPRHLLIIINGKAESGKDTAVRFLRDAFHDLDWKTMEHSAIDPIRDMLYDHRVVDRAAPKDEAFRKLLVTVGDACEDYSGFKTNEAVDLYQSFCNATTADVAFFLHMREPDLIAKIRTMAAAPDHVSLTVFVSGRGLDITSNTADANVANYAYDFTLANEDNLEILRQNCKNLAAQLAAQA